MLIYWSLESYSNQNSKGLFNFKSDFSKQCVKRDNSYKKSMIVSPFN